MSISPDAFVDCSGASGEIPQVCLHSRDAARRWQRHVDRILGVYAHHLGEVGAQIALTGSAALHRDIAPRENWRFDDGDTLVALTAPDNLAQRLHRTERACRALGGRFRSFAYAFPEGGKAGMRDVLGKAVCEFDRPLQGSRSLSRPYVPRVTTTFIAGPLGDHLKHAVAPSAVAYTAPSELVVANHRWNKCLTNRTVLSPSLASADEARLKFGGRGFWIDPARGPDDPPCAPRPAVPPRPPAPNVVSAARAETQVAGRAALQASELLRHIEKKQRAALVTAKIHYRAGAAWRNLRIAEGLTLAATGVLVLRRSVLFRSIRLRVATALTLTAAGAWLAEFPSGRAAMHQRAGADYGALEHEYSVLRAQLLGRRVRLDWADAQAVNLQRRKARLDRRTPNAPEWFKAAVKRDLRH